MRLYVPTYSDVSIFDICKDGSMAAAQLHVAIDGHELRHDRVGGLHLNVPISSLQTDILTLEATSRDTLQGMVKCNGEHATKRITIKVLSWLESNNVKHLLACLI